MKNYKEFINENIFDFLNKKKNTISDNIISYWIVPTKYPYFEKALKLIGVPNNYLKMFLTLFDPEDENNKSTADRLCIIQTDVSWKKCDLDKMSKISLKNPKFKGEIKLEDLENQEKYNL